MKTKPANAAVEGRRRLLTGAAALPAAAAMGGLPAAVARDAAPAAPAAAEERARGYHLSDHIRRYYALARF